MSKANNASLSNKDNSGLSLPAGLSFFYLQDARNGGFQVMGNGMK